MRRIPRSKTLLILALVLGVMSNILIAWWFAMTQDMFSFSDRYTTLKQPAGVTRPGPDLIYMGQHTHVGSIGWYVSYELGVNRPTELAPSFGPPLTIPSWATDLVTPWENEPEKWPYFVVPTTPYAIQAVHLRAHGWPLPSLHWYAYAKQPMGPAFTWGSRGGLIVPFLPSPDGMTPRPRLVLPYLPIAPGMVVNTVFYTVIWAVSLLLLRWWRVRRRVKRGLCLSCGYDLRGTPEDQPCPECGAV